MNELKMNIQPSHENPGPLLSIVIPVLEPDAELARCMYCIFGATQGLPAPEVVIVTPLRFVAAIAALYPSACVYAETRPGIYAAMNDGALASRGKYLYFIGKDDMLMPSLRNALSVLERQQPFVLFCDVYWGVDGVYSGRPSRLRLLTRNLCHQGVIYSREAFDVHGPYLRAMRVQADHLLNIKILWDRSAAGRTIYLKRPLAWYSGDGFSAVHRDAIFWRLYPRIMQRYVGNWAMQLLIVYRLLRGFYKKQKKNDI